MAARGVINLIYIYRSNRYTRYFVPYKKYIAVSEMVLHIFFITRKTTAVGIFGSSYLSAPPVFFNKNANSSRSCVGEQMPPIARERCKNGKIKPDSLAAVSKQTDKSHQGAAYLSLACWLYNNPTKRW